MGISERKLDKMFLYPMQKSNHAQRTQRFLKNEGGFVLLGIKINFKVSLVKTICCCLYNKEINKIESLEMKPSI